MALIQMVLLAFALSSNTQALQMNIHTAKNFNDYQYDKLMEAQQLVELVVNSAAFKSRVLNFTFQGKKQFFQNNGMSNEQIYELLMSGAEKYPAQTQVDGMMDYDLVLYKPKWYQSKKVLGYTNQDTRVIHINKLFYNRADVNEIAMNLVHEWVHKLGFGHDYYNNTNRPSSVPYGIGYIVRELGQ